MTEREALKLALKALKQIDEAMPFPVAKLAIMEAEKSLAQPEQEPVRVMGFNCVCGRRMEVSAEQGVVPAPQPVIDKSAAIRIATALGWEPKRKPLTDEEIDRICGDVGYGYISVARAIEAAHGIKD